MSWFEKDEIIRELREGYIIYSAYVVEKKWWDDFSEKMFHSNGFPDVNPIDNTSLM